tara:strand:+ start:3800 stop:3982 length:183 start_codon:yes stop_codon:yes gene_type:complete
MNIRHTVIGPRYILPVIRKKDLLNAGRIKIIGMTPKSRFTYSQWLLVSQNTVPVNIKTEY